jgi:hypothetical protein
MAHTKRYTPTFSKIRDAVSSVSKPAEKKQVMAEKAEVRSKVEKKFPSIDEKKKSIANKMK